MHLVLNDPRFTIKGNGDIVALSPVYVPPSGRTFSVLAQDNSGPEGEMEVYLVHSALQTVKVIMLHTGF